MTTIPMDEWKKLQQEFNDAFAKMVTPQIDRMKKEGVSIEVMISVMERVTDKIIEDLTESSLQSQIPKIRNEIREKFKAAVSDAIEALSKKESANGEET